MPTPAPAHARRNHQAPRHRVTAPHRVAPRHRHRSRRLPRALGAALAVPAVVAVAASVTTLRHRAPAVVRPAHHQSTPPAPGGRPHAFGGITLAAAVSAGRTRAFDPGAETEGPLGPPPPPAAPGPAPGAAGPATPPGAPAAPSQPAAAAAGPSPLGAFVVTCYALRGTTASGAPVGPETVAVDPSVIPLGTRLYVDGAGLRVAEDTGGAIRGHRLDIWEPTVAGCLAWGVQQRQVWRAP